MDITYKVPYTFTVDKDIYKIKATTGEVSSGFFTWPIKEYIDRPNKFYMEKDFDIHIPKGVSVIKINMSTFKGIPISRCVIIDKDTQITWLDFRDSSAIQYPCIRVTPDKLYRLTTGLIYDIDYEHGNLILEYSYDINNYSESSIKVVDLHYD